MITLNAGISVSLLRELLNNLIDSMVLSHFYVEIEDDEVILRAYYPGNGMYVGHHQMVKVYRLEHLTYAKEFAQDLNTLFNLKVPE